MLSGGQSLVLQAIADVEQLLNGYIQSTEKNKSSTWHYQAIAQLNKFKTFHQAQSRDIFSIQKYVLNKLAPKFTSLGSRMVGSSGSSQLRLNLERIARNWTETDIAFMDDLNKLLSQGGKNEPTLPASPADTTGQPVEIMDSVFFDTLGVVFTPQNAASRAQQRKMTQDLALSESCIPNDMYQSASDELTQSMQMELDRLEKTEPHVAQTAFNQKPFTP